MSVLLSGKPGAVHCSLTAYVFFDAIEGLDLRQAFLRNRGRAGPDDLAELRKENRMLRQEREVLKKATQFFAERSN